MRERGPLGGAGIPGMGSEAGDVKEGVLQDPPRRPKKQRKNIPGQVKTRGKNQAFSMEVSIMLEVTKDKCQTVNL